MKSLTIALATATEARSLDDDLAPLVAALQGQGAVVQVVDWDDREVDWRHFDVVVLRSTWDYTTRLAEFLDWVDHVASESVLLNPPAIVRWSTDKHYLADLQQRGIATVSSHFVEPADDAAAAVHDFLAAFPAAVEFVAKPCVGAGSRDARRHGRDQLDVAVGQIRQLQAQQRSVVLQPYLSRVDSAGETALLYFDGVYSHAIRKGPLLRRGEDSTRALFAAEQITAREPAAEELALAARVIASLAQTPSLLYARVDVIRDDDGQPCVLELELVEPSLFFAQSEGSADRFAAAIIARAGIGREHVPA